MSRPITQPINQVKLTNVATVRYQVGGRRFEIACYRNKVMDYRAGLETDVSEVLQTDRIFTNVSKGQFANRQDLNAAFGAALTEEEIAVRILQKGQQLQVSDLERQAAHDQAALQVAVWVADHCVNSETKEPYTVTRIQHALATSSTSTSTSTAASQQQQHWTVQPHKPIKKQCLDAVKFLKTVLPIERAKMELSLQYGDHQQDAVKEAIEGLPQDQIVILQHPQTNRTGTNDDGTTRDDSRRTLVLQVDPSLYRDFNALASKLPGSHLRIQQQVVVAGKQQQQTAQNQKQLEQSSSKSASGEESDRPRGEISDRVETQAATATNDRQGFQNGPQEEVRAGDDNENDDDDLLDNSQDAQPQSRKSQRRAAKKKKKKLAAAAAREQQQGEHAAIDAAEEGARHDTDNIDGDDSNNLAEQTISTRQQNKNQKKKDKKAKRRQQQQQRKELEKLAAEEEEEEEEEEDAAAAADEGKQAPILAVDDGSAPPKTHTTTTSQPPKNGKACNTCGGWFLSQSDFRAHFRSDWHRFNQKLKLGGKPPVSEQEFLVCDAESFFLNHLDN